MVALSYNSSSVGVATAGFSTYIILCCVDKGCVHVLLNAVVHPTPLTAYCWHSDFGPWGTYMRFATVCLFAIQTAFYRAHITTTISACVSALTMLALRYNLTLPRHCCTVHHAPRLLYTHKTCLKCCLFEFTCQAIFVSFFVVIQQTLRARMQMIL